jgi:hypothetical protein
LVTAYWKIPLSSVLAFEERRGESDRLTAEWSRELRKQGCGAAGYRLLGAEDGGYSECCCKRLVDDWRVITTFEPRRRHRRRSRPSR